MSTKTAPKDGFANCCKTHENKPIDLSKVVFLSKKKKEKRNP